MTTGSRLIECCHQPVPNVGRTRQASWTAFLLTVTGVTIEIGDFASALVMKFADQRPHSRLPGCCSLPHVPDLPGRTLNSRSSVPE